MVVTKERYQPYLQSAIAKDIGSIPNILVHPT